MHLEPRAIRSKVSREFGREDDLVTTEILYDSDFDSASEEEAVATDSSDSESTTSGDSEVSEDASPPPLSRKRKALPPQKGSSHKKQRRQKQLEADATNATLSSDRDDSEVDLPFFKKEPAIKQERAESPASETLPRNLLTKKRPSAQRSDFPNNNRQAEVIDLTMDDSTDEEGQGGGRGAVRALGRKFANMGGGKKVVKGRTELCGIL